MLRELDFKFGVEIGVSTGRYSLKLCEGIPGLRLYCVDPWKFYEGYVEQHKPEDQKNLNNALRIAQERLQSYDCEFVRKFSMDAVKGFRDETLDFVFIDGNHSYEYVIDDIREWSKKVKKGGIVAGHDYWNSADLKDGLWIKDMTPEEKIRLCQVKDAVNDLTKAEGIDPWFVCTGNKCPTWFWVKE
jgi:predicted O-methyltransferase YrrM